jgi:hypothetical protein
VAKKKKKKKTGAQRSTYAKGKPVGQTEKKKGPAPSAVAIPAAGEASGKKPAGKAAAGARTSGKKPAGKAAAGAQPEQQSWNLVRRGTLEMKIFLTLVVILVAVVLVQYPYWKDAVDKDYKANTKTYQQELKKWKQKYPTQKEQKAHQSSKPAQPKPPTFNDFLVVYAFFSLVESALFAFMGLNAARRTDMKMPILERFNSGTGKWADIRDLLVYGVPSGLVVLAPLVGFSYFGKSQGFSKTIKIQFATWKDGLYYASFSVQNQMLFVLLVFSALVWLFTRYRDRTRVEPHLAGLAGALVLAFLYFFNISRSASEKTTVSLVAAALVAAALVPFTGYLYWKKGLEYSLLAGVVGFAAYPFLASLIIR